MAANSSTNFINLDFDTLKVSLRNYLQQQPLFKDYDFTGSNMNVLLDILSYNTFHNAFYLNMVGIEMFLDSALLRDSVVSHAKELNYTPRSFRSAKAMIDVNVVATQNTNFITIPKNTQFTTTVGSNTYTFTTDRSRVVTDSVDEANTRVFQAKSVEIYEGVYQVESYSVNYAVEGQRFIISNPLVDTDSLTVVVSEDNIVTTFTRSTSLLGLTQESEIFFLQACEKDRYEIVFGNDILGRRPKNGATILVEYRTSAGELPNGASEFYPDQAINGFADITCTTIKAAYNGAISESVEDIKYYAPRHYQAQERAVTATDYEILLKRQFPEIDAISAYGGEELTPPTYGKVYLTTDLIGFEGTPQYKKEEFLNWIKTRTPLTIEPVFVDPTFVYCKLECMIKYNSNITDLAPADISARVLAALEEYSKQNFNRFKTKVRSSKLITVADTAHPSIVLSFIEVFPFFKIQPTPNVAQNFSFKFPFKINNHVFKLPTNHATSLEKSISSSPFIYEGKVCELEDDNDGTIRVVTMVDNQYRTITNVGTIDYDTGEININNFTVQQLFGNAIKVYLYSEETDFVFDKNYLFSIKSEDIEITVQDVKE